MKTFWKFDIDNKTAQFNDSEVIYKFRFEASLDGALVINKVETLEDNKKIDLSKMHTYMRHLGDELHLLHFEKKFVFSDETDWDDVKMYKIEDNIYIDEDACIVVLTKMGFMDTEFMCDIDIDNIENTPINLAKLMIFEDNNYDTSYTFAQVKESLKDDDL